MSLQNLAPQCMAVTPTGADRSGSRSIIWSFEPLLQYDQFFGPDFTIEYPTGSGQPVTLRDIAGDLADRLISIWLPGPDGRRPVYGGVELMQTDPAWKDNLLVL